MPPTESTHQGGTQGNKEGSSPAQDTVPEIIDSGPMCITDLFQNKYLAYFIPK